MENEGSIDLTAAVPGLRGFSEALQDPHIVQCMKSVDAYNDELAARKDTPPTQEELEQRVKEFDEEWGLLGQPVKITGNLIIPGEDGDSKMHYVEDFQVMSRGFIPLIADGDATRLLHGDTGAVCMAPMFRIEYLPDGMHVSQKYDNEKLEAMDVVSSTDILVEAQQHSLEHANAWLENYYPDLMEEVDGRLYAGDVESETDMLLGLKGLDLSDISDDLAAQARLETYLTEIIEPDKFVPYIMGFKGDVFLPREGGYMEQHKTEAVSFVIIEAIRPLSMPNEDDVKVQLVVVARVDTGDRSTNPGQYVLTVDGINALHSLRSQHTAD